MRILLVAIFAFFVQILNAQESDSAVQDILATLENKVAPEPLRPSKIKGKKDVIEVRTQADLEQLNERIHELLHGGSKHVVVQFGKGDFLFTENQLTLEGIHDDEASIEFSGKGTILSARDYQRGVALRSETETSPDTVEIVDPDRKLCRIHLHSIPAGKIQQIQLTEWFLSRHYDVESITDGWAYFIAPELFYSTGFPGTWNVNWDWGYCKALPRYRLFAERDTCRNACFLKMKNCQLQQIRISGITFSGNGGNHPLLEMQNVATKGVWMEHCTFSDLHDRALYVYRTPYVTFRHNQVNRSYGCCLVSGAGCDNTIIIENEFNDNCMGLNNTPDVTLYSRDFYVARNKFHNVQYSAVSIGYNYQAEKQDSVTGIIERNEMWQDSTFLANYRKYTLMDGGPIYVSTQVDDVVIRYNYIHDITGIRDNRGIFCDDGAKNLKIYGNVIHGIRNSYCIDSRLVASVAKQVPDYNTGNVIMYNVIGGRYKFEGRKDSLENNVKSHNFLVSSLNEVAPRNVIHDLKVMEDDVVMEQEPCEDSRIGISSGKKKILTHSPVWKGIKQWIRFVR